MGGRLPCFKSSRSVRLWQAIKQSPRCLHICGSKALGEARTDEPQELPRIASSIRPQSLTIPVQTTYRSVGSRESAYLTTSHIPPQRHCHRQPVNSAIHTNSTAEGAPVCTAASQHIGEARL
jgi:hypothetical protein